MKEVLKKQKKFKLTDTVREPKIDMMKKDIEKNFDMPDTKCNRC